MTLQEYFKDWIDVIDVAELNKVISTINILYQSRPIVPKYSNIFKAFTLCTKKDCRVVFLGQDPYPQKGIATGVLFGNKKDTIDISPSLQVIRDSVISLEDNLMPSKSFDITMESWAYQGILMINSALTCEMNKVGSHVMLWRPFLSKFIFNLSRSKRGIVYVLFGNQAQSFEPYIAKDNIVFTEKHPAFYSRIGKPMPHNIFYKINSTINGEPIHWCTDF